MICTQYVNQINKPTKIHLFKAYFHLYNSSLVSFFGFVVCYIWIIDITYAAVACCFHHSLRSCIIYSFWLKNNKEHQQCRTKQSYKQTLFLAFCGLFSKCIKTILTLGNVMRFYALFMSLQYSFT